jgi:hypothetical protein
MTNNAYCRVCSIAGLGLALLSAPVRAQSTQTPAPAPAPTQAPAEPASEPLIGENYRVELSAGVWATMPSTVQYSDTETITTGTPATSTTVNGTIIDFKGRLGLHDQRFPEFHLVVRPARKHKIRADYIPLYYKQSATLTAALDFDGQSYLAGQTVASTLHWDAWQLGYEYDVITANRGYIGGIVGVNYFNINGALANGTQSGSASVHIPMPGLGAIGRFYPGPRISITGEFMGYYLPGSSTSTHGHVIDIDGYATVHVSKFVGLQGGYRSFDAAHVWGSPLNTGTFTIRGPYVGGTLRY